MHCLWSVLAWSMQHMYFGKFPEKAADGKGWQHKLARSQKAGTLLNSAGLCGMIFAITADGGFFQNGYKLPGSSDAEYCWSCGANRSSHPHNDYGINGGRPSRTTRTATPQCQASMATPWPMTLCTSWSWEFQPTLWATLCSTWW